MIFLFLILLLMEKEIAQTLNFIQIISDRIHYFVRDNIADSWVLQVVAKGLVFGFAVYLIDFLLKTILNAFFKIFLKEDRFPLLKAIRNSKMSNSVAHLSGLFAAQMSLSSVFWRHKQSLGLLERMVELAIVLVLANMAFRFLTAIRLYYNYKNDHYRILALNAISQTIKILGIFVFTVIAICVIFGINGSTIFGSLGAITAVLLLVFRDTILGFVTGIHVSTSRNMKVGDWIGIPKYNLEGTIEDINLLTTKIQNFDKTVSTIPTYDLMSTEIKNLQVMTESNTRRIKRSIIFNISSFKYLNREAMEKLEKINLISDYVRKKKEEIIAIRSKIENADLLINGRQLTNIGVFREYAYNYLKNNENIVQDNSILVRQLENTAQGMPLEIYCFTNNSAWATYEDIQADIFDHLLVASKEFDLEIMQFVKIEKL